MTSLLLCLLLPATVTPAIVEVDLARFFADIDATFVVYDPQRDVRTVHDAERAARRFLPASTFKIANTLIALETGVAGGPDFALPWDRKAFPPADWWPQSWRRDQTLSSAFRNSVVWYYREIAQRVGEQRMREFLERFDYGNREISGGLDRFWLRGGLRISPDEQLDFLRRLYEERLDVSSRSTRIVKELMLLEDSGGYRLSGKTGTAMVTETRELGWLVGFVEVGESVFYYALNIEGERVWEDWPPGRRSELLRRLLAAVDVISGDRVNSRSEP